MASIAVVGAQGYVGSALCEALEKMEHTVIRITRENYKERKSAPYDILVNASMPAGRFAAKQDPARDFIESVQKTADLLYGWKYGKFLQISTISARSQLDTVYGRHKAAAEKLVNEGESLIVRLGPMYSSDLKKGVLMDIAEGKKVYVDGASRYCFAPRDFVANWIAHNLEKTGIKEVGARNSIALQDIAIHLGKTIEFEGTLDHQEVESVSADFPDARDVLSFMEDWKVQ